MIPLAYRPIIESLALTTPPPVELFPTDDEHFCMVRLNVGRAFIDGRFLISSRRNVFTMSAGSYLLMVAPDDDFGGDAHRFHVFEIIGDRVELVWAAAYAFPGGILEKGEEIRWRNLLIPAERPMMLEDQMMEEAQHRLKAILWLRQNNLPIPGPVPL